MIVVDASAMLDALLNTPAAEPARHRLFASGETLHAPHLLDIEVTQVIRRYEAAGHIDDERGREALADLAECPLQRYAHTALLPRIWNLRYNLTAHDAVYVALAEALDAPLITRDKRLASASGHHAQIELV